MASDSTEATVPDPQAAGTAPSAALRAAAAAAGLRRFDTLFARIFVGQLVTMLILLGVLGALLFSAQGAAVARATAPIWAVALTPLVQELQNDPTARIGRSETVSTTVLLEPGPPPADAVMHPMAPQFVALRAALRDYGLPLRAMAISGSSGDSVTWLQLQTAQGDVWVGVRGALEGADVRRRGIASVLIALAVFVIAALAISRRIAAPLRKLERAVAQAEHPALIDAAPVPAPGLPAHGPHEVRVLAERFARYTRQRAQFERARQTMLAGISHDLRSPLSRIRLAAELLPDLPQVNERRAAIVRNAQLADQLVGRVLDLTRSTVEPLDDRVDLVHLLRDAAADAPQPVALSVEVRGEVMLEPASRIGLQRALANLIDNAFKHGAPPVTLHLSVDGSEAVVVLRDHGTGLAATDLAQVTQPFYRAQSARTSPGAGLGLSIVENTIARHGGRLRLADAAPGLCVELRLPCVASARR
jgi:two-component system, OmpR family, osmolarity sensor histidine kinase EnvZ